jgi:hypothetical protein
LTAWMVCILAGWHCHTINTNNFAVPYFGRNDCRAQEHPPP